jgi:hypothetical protein
VIVFVCLIPIHSPYSLHLPDAMSDPPDTLLTTETRKPDASASSR